MKKDTQLKERELGTSEAYNEQIQRQQFRKRDFNLKLKKKPTASVSCEVNIR